MNRRPTILILLLSIACTAMGIALGAQSFGCDEDQYGADHVFFKASDCFQSVDAKGVQLLTCIRATEVQP